MRGLIVDNFAGGGGASTGIEMATGRSVDIAINHDPHAIAMHSVNHPGTLHYCESVFDIDPLKATAGFPVWLGWFSPDCRHFSKAKGATPVAKEIRGLAWIVLRWALAVRPKVMMLENVEEFKTWGPLLAPEMRPDPARAGETFKAFCSMLNDGIDAAAPAFLEACEFLGISPDSEEARKLKNGLGYQVDYRELRACDYGTPTIRKRFFMVMRCDGQPIAWPEPTHGNPESEAVKSGRLRPWKTAADCIDWSIPGKSIFGRKKSLATNTLRRIGRGIQKFVINDASPFLVKCNHTSTRNPYDCFRGQALENPLQTITKKHGFAVVIPHLTKFRTGATGQRVGEPVPTVTAGTSKRPGGNGHALGLVGAVMAPLVVRQFGKSTGHHLSKPSATVTAGGGGKSQLAAVSLIQVGYGERPGQSPRVPGLNKPLGTVVAGGGKHAVMAAHIVKHFGGNYSGAGVHPSDPLRTITATDHHGVIASHMIKLRGTCKDGQRIDEPAPTVTAGGLHLGEIQVHLHAAGDHPNRGNVLAFLREYCEGVSSDIIEIKGELYQIVDITMRMLQPHELYAAQGFPSDYVIDKDSEGNRYAKDKQVARCGNAVPPQFAEALVRANLPELCQGRAAA
ncbi:DNA cytosine methyltransferase [Enterobacter roggenkampii]|uniref:DNA cytosine methyltransferase n=1 Tax=Enterobacter roggenkampii TaxID=1812935 RepID=UPI00388FFCFC